eukprot:scaffold4329_cov115-Cylindrotheca_fusiformis.AAC.5
MVILQSLVHHCTYSHPALGAPPRNLLSEGSKTENIIGQPRSAQVSLTGAIGFGDHLRDRD